MISDEIGLAIMNDCNFEDYTYPSPHNATDSCNNAIEEANSIVGDYINNYDVILDVCYPSLVQQELRLRKLVSFLFLQSSTLPLFSSRLNDEFCDCRLPRLVLELMCA